MTKQFTFPLSDLDLDDLHFISPCTDAAIKMLKRSGVPGATNRLCEQHAISKTLDNCNQYPLARLEVSIYQNVMFTSHLYCFLGPIFQEAHNGSIRDSIITFSGRSSRWYNSRRNLESHSRILSK